jgi:sugar phosphate permease
MIYVSAHYFPITMLGFLVCLGDSLGRLGAVFASGPYAELITFISWKVSLFWIGLFGLLISAALYYALPTSPVASETQTHVIDVLTTLLKEKSMWLICCVSSFLVVFTTAFAGLWGVPFLEAAYKMSKTTASFAISVFFLGAILGSPSIGYISDRLMRRKPFLMFAGFFGTFLTLLLVYTPIFSSLGVYFLLFLLGILTSIQNLTYCVAIENNHPKFKGVISGYVNLFVFLIGATSQPLVGYLLERHSTLIFQSSSMYTFKDYQYSFWCFPLFFFLSFILSIPINDKKKV